MVLRHEFSPVNLLHIFITPYSKKTSKWLLLSFTFLDFSVVLLTEPCILESKFKTACKSETSQIKHYFFITIQSIIEVFLLSKVITLLTLNEEVLCICFIKFSLLITIDDFTDLKYCWNTESSTNKESCWLFISTIDSKLLG